MKEVRPDGSSIRRGPEASASFWSDGNVIWLRGKKPHRDGGPATIGPDGAQGWIRTNKLHREDGPAVITPSWGRWYREGRPMHKVVRRDGSVTTFPIDMHEGSVRWHRRDCGPATIQPDGTQFWRKDGKAHRDGGPSALYPNGHREWRWHGHELPCRPHAPPAGGMP
jgi:hypothetical protein